MEDIPADLAGRYRDFADHEAHGRSPLYENLARGIADDPEILSFLARLPAAKRQPNLFLAAVRYLRGTPVDWADFRAFVVDHPNAIRAVMLARSTQTNEPARCATLLPALAQLPEPLALLEMGASAGLCLLPDRFGYDYGRLRLSPVATAPVFPCRASPSTPMPARGIDVIWRAGLDLNPIDVHDTEQVAWLETLIWPGQQDRLDRFRAAVAVARVNPPRVVRGDLRTNLPALVAEAPKGATLVVFHTAVVAYIATRAERRAFSKTVQDLNAVWLANEAPHVLAEAEEEAPEGRFLLSLNGRSVAWTDPHGASVDWFG